ncbi:MAG: peptidase domain-containing ABC transporter [Candidatus Kapabacteria bacterium]|nr:peptidase domain-containing ABC transporter [Candidatus Kapabacteria bacterium]
MPRFRAKSFPFLKQRDQSECGTTCLAMILEFYGIENVQPALREIAGVWAHGTDLLTLARTAERFGFRADGVRMRFEHLTEVPLPLIAHYRGNHFVVVYRATPTHVWIADPAVGKERLTKDEFLGRWNGIALVLEPTGTIAPHADIMDILERYRRQERSFAQLLRRIIGERFRRPIVEILLASLLLAVLGISLPLFTQAIIDNVLVLRNNALLVALAVAMTVIVLMQLVLVYVRQLLVIQSRIEFEYEFFTRFFERMIHLGQQYFDSHRREDFIQRFQENLKLRSLLSSGTVQALLDVVLIVVLTPVLWLYHAGLGAIATVVVLLFGIATALFTPRLRTLQNKVFAENARTMGAFLDTLLGITTIKLLAAELPRLWQWRGIYKYTLNNVHRTMVTQARLSIILRSLVVIGQVAIYWIGAWITSDGAMSVGEYVAFLAIFGIVLSASNSIGELWIVLTELGITFARLGDVLQQEPEVRPGDTYQPMPARTDIQLLNVSFAYTPQSAPVLRNISLAIPEGSRIGIIGRNGSGKTTLAKLLVRLYDTYTGSLTIGDVELRSIHPAEVRKHIVLLPQDPYIFDGTIAENIALAKPDATMEEILWAAQQAELHTDIQRLYLGYHQRIGNSGAQLSGGQRLKIALARLFLTDARILILDEASSALDAISEERIMRNLYTHFAGRTIISIAHRMTTLQHVDRIIVLDRGEIVEEGSHDELLARQGIYYQFLRTYVEL